MIAQNTLRRPANWQDFEHLCYRLWREVWKCPEIQKNGRLGQSQNGVDIFGIPQDEDEYWGIQCKGKSEYNDDQYDHPQFTAEEIDEEIEKAKTFTPKLKKLYFATTALNDAKIQAHIRQRNLDHITAGLFEIHMFAWEAIADLIDEHKPVHEWYANNRKYRVDQSVEISFADGSTEIQITPKFRKTNTHYYPAFAIANLPEGSLQATIMRLNRQFEGITPVNWDHDRPTINRSLVPVRILITNTGHASIEDYKLTFYIEGDVAKISRTNRTNRMFSVESFRPPTTNLRFFSEGNVGQVLPDENALVGKDAFLSDEIFLGPTITAKSITIKWQLVAKEFNKEGELIVHVVPDITINYKEIPHEDLAKGHWTVQGDIEEFIESVN